MSDARIKKDVTQGRENRSAQDRERAAPEDKFVNQRERRRFRNEFQQVALPTVPEIPGYHCCWLSTNSQYDPLYRRQALGYQIVRADELEGFDTYKVKEGEQSGSIMCQEMILCKMPMDLYQDIMAENHHWAPLDEAEKIRVNDESLLQKRDSKGKPLVTAEGGIPDENDKMVPEFT
jgi:hypothetical protein